MLKHASNVPGCAVALQEIFRRAGFPAAAFQTLLMGPERVGRVIADERVKAVTLTGSESAGSRVAEQAGQHIKKTVMELGGSDAFIVLPSANLEAAVKTAIAARTINNGQSCIAAKRFIVHAQVYEEFERRMVAGLAQLKATLHACAESNSGRSIDSCGLRGAMRLAWPPASFGENSSSAGGCKRWRQHSKLG